MQAQDKKREVLVPQNPISPEWHLVRGPGGCGTEEGIISQSVNKRFLHFEQSEVLRERLEGGG